MFNPETDLSIPPVSDQEVKSFLGHTSMPKPYGNKLIAHIRSILDILAKDVEIRAYYGATEYVLPPAQFEGFKKVMGPIPEHSLRPALNGFINERLPQAIARHPLPSPRNPSP